MHAPSQVLSLLPSHKKIINTEQVRIFFISSKNFEKASKEIKILKTNLRLFYYFYY